MTRIFRPSIRPTDRPSELTWENNASSSKTIRDNLTKFCMRVKRSILHNHHSSYLCSFCHSPLLMNVFVLVFSINFDR